MHGWTHDLPRIPGRYWAASPAILLHEIATTCSGQRLGEGTVPNLKPRRLFISHSWSHLDGYDRLTELLAAAPNFVYHDYSVPKDDPVHNAPNIDALYQAIKRQMSYCHVILIMAGKYATYRKWIQREIEIAKRDLNKPVLAIRPWANAQVSLLVTAAADRLVEWNTKSVVAAIRQLAP